MRRELVAPTLERGEGDTAVVARLAKTLDALEEGDRAAGMRLLSSLAEVLRS